MMSTKVSVVYDMALLRFPSGKHLHNHGKSAFLFRKHTISMSIFNSYVTNYDRVQDICLNQSDSRVHIDQHPADTMGGVRDSDLFGSRKTVCCILGVIASTLKIVSFTNNDGYPLVIQHRCRKSPWSMGKSTINSDFPFFF